MECNINETTEEGICIQEYQKQDLEQMIEIWNAVVKEGKAFPQLTCLEEQSAQEFFASQSFVGVAKAGEAVLGLYILHPNNVGRCGHIANASYAVKETERGRGIGEALVRHCLEKGKEIGFKLLQFNAVVKSNQSAIHLYEKLGFVKIGEVAGGFWKGENDYEDIILYYHTLS